MPRFQLRPKDKETFEKVREIIEGTNILKTQDDLLYGHWDFVVVGPTGRNSSLIMEGCARQARIINSPIYLTTLIDPGINEKGMGIQLEDLVSETPEELRGLEVLQVDPLRPFTISARRGGPALKEAVDQTLHHYGDKNIAIIQTPEAKYWGVSVMKYLHEFDRSFPDYVTEAIRTGNLPLNGSFLQDFPSSRSQYFH